MTAPIPQGFHTITPNLILEDSAAAIELYQKAFGATEDYRLNCPVTGKVMHACVTIGNSKVFLADVNPQAGEGCEVPSRSSFYLYFQDVDAVFKQATQAGLKSTMEPADMFWGDRMGSARDKFGIQWSLATHVRDVSQDEIAEGAKQMAKQAGKAA